MRTKVGVGGWLLLLLVPGMAAWAAHSHLRDWPFTFLVWLTAVLVCYAALHVRDWLKQ